MGQFDALKEQSAQEHFKSLKALSDCIGIIQKLDMDEITWVIRSLYNLWFRDGELPK